MIYLNENKQPMTIRAFFKAVAEQKRKYIGGVREDGVEYKILTK